MEASENKRVRSVIAFIGIVLGILLLITAVIYFIEPARSLPHFFPGYDALLIRQHRTHAIAAFILALLVFAFVWFETGTKKSSPQEKNE